MNPARSRSNRGRDIFQESDYVVIGSLFDLQNFRNREASPFANFRSVFLRDLPKLGHCFTGKSFDLEPDFKLPLVRPDVSHRRAGVTVDHAANIESLPHTEKQFCGSNLRRPPVPGSAGASLARDGALAIAPSSAEWLRAACHPANGTKKR